MKHKLPDCPLCDIDRAPPGSLDMDRCTLSCMMQAPGFAVPLAVQLLTPADFSTEACSLLFDIVTQRHAGGELVDPASITGVLYDRDQIGKVGGPAFVSEVYTASPNPAHVTHYAKEVLSASKRRQLVCIATNMVTAAAKGDGKTDWRQSISVLLQSAELTLTDSAASPVKDLREVAREYCDYMDGSGAASIDPPVATGISELDAILGGGMRREYIIIGGKSGHGKTLLAMQIAGKMAEAGRAGLIVGYEMSNLQLFMRDLARETRLPLDQIMGRAAPCEGLHQTLTRKITQMMERWRVKLIDDGRITPEAVAAHARHLHRQGALDYIVIDYLQLVPVQRAKDQRRDEVLAELSAGFARLRKELGCSLIVPVQLNDDGLIRDSRAIVHPAECFLRIEMQESENDETGETEVGTDGLIRVLKNRFGEVNKFASVSREGRYQTFTDREPTPRAKKAPRQSDNGRDRRAPHKN